MLRVCLILLLTGFTQLSLAQSDKASGPIDQQTISFNQLPDSLQLDSFSLVPGSLSITVDGQVLDTSLYHYDYATGYLHIAEEAQKHQSLVSIQYRKLSFSLCNSTTKRSLSLYDSTAFFREESKQKWQSGLGAGEELFVTPNLAKSGSISRGISVGNQSSIFVNASLNLQLEGQLTDDLRIKASITDQNIPVQPEGNAQHIRDFDNVLVELYNQNLSLQAGDVVFQQSGTVWQGNERTGNGLQTSSDGPYFLRYRRNVQGAQFRWKQSNQNNGHAETRAGFALAKGKFTSLELKIQEGVQGPYQLQSGDNQTLGGGNGRQLGAFFIIANSEKVYLDGKLLKRGLTHDYTIDYNLGEITFTSNVLLTRFSRVYVDFEYADRNYSRSIFTISHQQQFKNLNFYLDYFREADNPNQSLDFSLRESDKALISEAGDTPHHLLIPSADSVKHVPNQPDFQVGRNADVPGVGNLYRVTYNRIDSLVAGQSYQVYQFAGQNGAFRVDFHFVGEGLGDYEISGATVNSKVYQWIAPINGQSRGSYAPVRPVVTPKRHQVLVMGAEAQLSSYDFISTELAVSDQDLNVLSPRDAHDDRGQAVNLNYRANNRKILKSSWKWSNETSYEFRQHHFREIDPYRSIEFERDWFIQSYQVTDTSYSPNDHILSSAFTLSQNAANHFRYQWMGRKQENMMLGQQHHMHWQKSLGIFQLSGEAFMLRNHIHEKKAEWNRINANIFIKGRYFRPGYTFKMDKNQQSNAESDSVSFTSMNFEQHQFYVQSGDSLNGTFRLDYRVRKDFLPYEGVLSASDLANTLRATADLNMLPDHDFKLQLTYREVAFVNEKRFSQRLENRDDMQRKTILGQLHWNSTLAQGAIRSELHYNLANGREPRREFVYVRVPVGEGIYTWRDDNNNGIEELDEFYEARYFDEKNYLRIFVPGNDFMLAYTNSLDYRIKIQPPSDWLDKGGIKSLLGRFSSVTSWDIRKRISDSKLAARTLPMTKVDDNHLLSLKENLRSTLFFNRSSTVFSADIGVRRIHRKQLLNRGFEERQRAAYLLNLRWNLSRQWGFRWQGESGQETQLLDLSKQENSQNGRNFQIHYYELTPEVSWQPNMNTRITTSYSHAYRQNLANPQAENQSEVALQHVIGLELRMNKMVRHTVQANLEYVSINYNAEENSAIAYEMLEGLRNGNNLRWTLNWQQQILEGLQLSVNYFGRKSADRSTIHSGTMMLRALF